MVGGTVGFYAPGTLTPATTYQDSAGTITNTNPITLDSRGQCLVWGAGTYRQIVKDVLGVVIWDQLVSTAPSASIPTSFPGLLLATQTFTSSSTYTPTPGTTKIKVRAIGGGGAGGAGVANSSTAMSCGSGGASGSWAEALYFSAFSGTVITIGAGATGGASSGTAGGTTSFGALLVCPGGGGGPSIQLPTSTTFSAAAQASAGAAPTGSGITFGARGVYGPCGLLTGSAVVSGQGASSPYGGGGGNSSNGAGGAAIGYGAGGGGGASIASGGLQLGGSGTNGIVIIEEYT